MWLLMVYLLPIVRTTSHCLWLWCPRIWLRKVIFNQNDVYSFGVLMLKLLTGQKFYDWLAAQLEKMNVFYTYLSPLHNTQGRP